MFFSVIVGLISKYKKFLQSNFINRHISSLILMINLNFKTLKSIFQLLFVF